MDKVAFVSGEVSVGRGERLDRAQPCLASRKSSHRVGTATLEHRVIRDGQTVASGLEDARASQILARPKHGAELQ